MLVDVLKNTVYTSTDQMSYEEIQSFREKTLKRVLSPTKSSKEFVVILRNDVKNSDVRERAHLKRSMSCANSPDVDANVI